MLSETELQDLLNFKYYQYNHPSFISNDPISIPHRFSKKEDIEISGFLAATISWGQRITIIKNAKLLTEAMGGSPHEFILNFKDSDLKQFTEFKHRTFNFTDLVFFLKSLQEIYRHKGGMERLFSENFCDVKTAIVKFRTAFLQMEHLRRSEKHIANPDMGSASKRINMFLRWMVRDDKSGVDFGLWKDIPTSALYLPLDVHTANVAAKLGLLKRKQQDWKAVEEVTASLRLFDPNDPVKYDYALFGLGIFEDF